MEVIDTSIPDVKIIQPKIFGDERGYFMETYRHNWFQDNVANVDFVQDNQSSSSYGILRGLHYQIAQTQGKLVRVLKGEVFDVAVDLRKSSETFGQWFGELLSAENQKQMWVPPGFAHGFYVTSEMAEFSYKCTDYYAPQHERSLIWNDESLAIDWPTGNQEPILSDKDKQAQTFKECEKFA